MVPWGGVEVVAGGEGKGAGLEDAGGAAADDEGGGRNPETERAVELAKVGDEELELLVDWTDPTETDVDVDPVPVVKPSSLWAAALSEQPTNTPRTVVIGRAKHSWPLLQTVVMTKLPWLSHVPTFPAMQAISPLVQGDEKLSVEKRLL
jgi:hypothetical protein